MTQQPSARGLIWRNGLIFGGIIIAIALVDLFTAWKLGAYDIASQINTGARATDPLASIFRPSTFVGLGAGLVEWALYFTAGMLTARKTGSVGAASLTGLVAGVVGALAGGVLTIILLITVIVPQIPALPAGSPLTAGQFQAILIGSAIFGAVIGVLTGGGIGAGLGALGGLAGRGAYQQANPPQAYQESFYGAPAGYAPPPPPPAGYAPPQVPPPLPPTPPMPPQQG